MTDEFEQSAPAEQEAVAAEAPQEAAEAPEKAEPAPEQPKPSRSAREALEKAFKDYDSQPKEPGEREASKEEGKADGPARNPDGTFAKKETAESDPKPEAEKAEAKAEEKQPISEPPARFSADAKAAWKDAPESVRGEINRAVKELEAGLSEYQQVVEPLKPFLSMAQQQRVDPAKTIEKYVRMEQALFQNPRAGLEAIAQNMGLSLEGLIQKATGNVPEGQRDTVIDGLREEIGQLKQQLGQVSTGFQRQQYQTAEQQVAAFAEANPRFEELAPEIQRLLASGYAPTLEKAYEIADRLNPAPTVPDVPATPPAAAQTRVAKSVTGAPSAGSNPVNRQPSTSNSEALRRAFGTVGLT